MNKLRHNTYQLNKSYQIKKKGKTSSIDGNGHKTTCLYITQEQDYYSIDVQATGQRPSEQQQFLTH